MNTETPCIDRHSLTGHLLEIKALIGAANRAVWQDGRPGEDEGLVQDAVCFLEIASEKVLTVLGKI